MSGLVHIYTGNGKGKTTAAVGLAVRAAGHGKRVLFVQLLKDNSSGELGPLRQLGITVRGLSKPYGFVRNMTQAERQQVAQEHNQLLRRAAMEAVQGQWDMLILDEIMAACASLLAQEALVDALLAKRPQGLELVLTGRHAPHKWLAQADYVTEMTLRKHPYQQGIGAREGIEY